MVYAFGSTTLVQISLIKQLPQEHHDSWR